MIRSVTKFHHLCSFLIIILFKLSCFIILVIVEDIDKVKFKITYDFV
jgi:hypothetical protein